MSFGEKLKKLRLESKMTQEELAQKCGMKKQNISRYENSAREPNVRTAKVLADALGVSLEYLTDNKQLLDLQFFAEKKQIQLTEHQAHLIEVLNQYPPETQDMLIDRAEALLNVEDMPTPANSPNAKELDALKAIIHVQNEELARLHELKEHLESRITFLLEQIEKKDRRMDEKDEIIRRLMGRLYDM